MQNYHPPEYKKLQFNCIHCGAYAKQSWQNFYCWNKLHAGYSIHKPLESCVCEQCKKWSYWYEGHMIIPSVAFVPPAHMDMPLECIADYNEARGVVDISARAASALLRLSLQKLMIVLGEAGRNINEDIENLVQKGLPIEVRQVLNSCHITDGNGIESNDTQEGAYNLFRIINFIIEDRISKPRNIQSLFAKLPEHVKKTAYKRDRFDT